MLLAELDVQLGWRMKLIRKTRVPGISSRIQGAKV